MEKEITDEKTQKALREAEEKAKLEKEEKERLEKEKNDPYSKENLNKLEDDSYMPNARSIEGDIEERNASILGNGGWGGI